MAYAMYFPLLNVGRTASSVGRGLYVSFLSKTQVVFMSPRQTRIITASCLPPVTKDQPNVFVGSKSSDFSTKFTGGDGANK